MPGDKPLRKRLLSGAIWSAIGRIGSIGALFGSHALLARELSKSDYAAYLIVSVAVILLSLLGTLGTSQVLIRAIRQNRFNEQANQIGNILSTAIQIIIASCAVVVCIFYLASYFLSEDVKWSGLRDHTLLVSIWFCLSTGCFLLSSALLGMDDYRSAVMVGARRGGALPNLLFIVAVLIFKFYGQLDLRTVIGLQVVFNALALMLACWLLMRRLGRLNSVQSGAQQLSDVEPLTGSTLLYGRSWFLRESWPNLLNQTVAIVLAELDVFWAAYYVSAADVAFYGVSKQLVMLVSAPFMISAIALGPFIAELFTKLQFQRMQRLLRGSATVVGLPSLAVLLIFLTIPEHVLGWVYGETYQNGATALQILAVGQMIFVLSGCNGLTLTMTGHQRGLFVCSFTTMLLYVMLAPVAFRGWGIVGGAAINSILFASQNIVVTVLVKLKVGIWTVASLSPGVIKDFLGTGRK